MLPNRPICRHLPLADLLRLQHRLHVLVWPLGVGSASAWIVDVNLGLNLGFGARMRARASTLLTSVGIIAAAVVIGPACNRPNPLYQAGAGPDAATGAAGGQGAAGNSGAAGDESMSGNGGATGAGGTAVPPDGGAGDGGRGTGQQAGDCLAAQGAPPCGAWVCSAGQCAVSCPSCTDNDQDGFGVGAGCAGPDCDDMNPAIGSSGARACYDGKGGTMGVGACHAGTQICSGGVWATCAGEVVPSGEACNGVDDDCDGKTDNGLGTITCGLGVCAQTIAACTNGVLGVCHTGAPAGLTDGCDGKDNNCNGAVDEDCDSACVHVAPNGDDMAATGTGLRPFRTIQAAIDFAAGAAMRPKNVCVAGGDTCLSTNVYQASDGNPINMANGVSVYGSYEAITWTRCPFGTTGLPNVTVTIAPRSTAGVIFPMTVTAPTTLDGVRITRFGGGGGDGGGGGGPTTTTAAITISGAKQVVISNVVVDDAPDVTTSYGVSLTNGAQALITRSAIFGGGASGGATGVHSVGSTPTIRENCATIDAGTGHCTAPCSATSLGIHGRYAPQNGGGGGGNDTAPEAVAIDLVDSPNAVLERNAICGAQATAGYGVRISGAAMGTVVRGNSIAGQGSTDQAFGVSLQACDDAAPWIVDNELLSGDASGTATRAAGVNVVGACHPVIESNTKIATGGDGAASAFGIFCGADATATRRCAIIDNALVQGSASSLRVQAFGIDCDAGACAHVSGNTVTGNVGGTVVGLLLSSTGALVDRNVITGGCGTKTTTGILTDDAFSRIENNVVRGAQCDANATTAEADGLRVQVAAGGNEVDVNSNTIDAGGAGQCTGSAGGVSLTTAPSPKTPRGIFRDNILRAGACAIGRDDFVETSSGTTPRLFEHNDLDPTGMPTGLYLTGAGQSLSTLKEVNALAGATGNISADPMFAGPADLHLGAGSACINAGTPVGAPRTDFDGKVRDAKPDIGAYER